MRYLTVLASPSESDTLHPLGKSLSEEPSFSREAIHHAELLENNTVLLFAEGSGDQERYKEIMEASPYVREYIVSGDERWMAVSQFEASDMTRRLMELAWESDVVIETPVHINGDGSLRITYLGSDSDIRGLFERMVEESDLRFEVVSTGQYEPEEDLFVRLLTDRQQEVLEAAVEMGYYSAPRQATQEDVANCVGLASATIGEHLQKIEERIFSALVE